MNKQLSTSEDVGAGCEASEGVGAGCETSEDVGSFSKCCKL
jgi:hypothetical protein